jgi:hypothetical protein
MRSIVVACAALTIIVRAPRTLPSQATAADGGTPESAQRNERRPKAGNAPKRISKEDREVLDNFELLLNLDECKDLDLLIEISKST